MLPLQLVFIILCNVDKNNNVNYQVCLLEFSSALGSLITGFHEINMALVMATWCPMRIFVNTNNAGKMRRHGVMGVASV